MSETIEKHGVVVEHKGFKIGDGIFVKHKKIKGIVTGIDTSNVYRFRVEGEKYASWTTCDNIEHLADYELRTAREEFEEKFKGKKIRIPRFTKDYFIKFFDWGKGYNFIDTKGESYDSRDDWQILEEPEEEPHNLDDLKVGDVIENDVCEFLVVGRIKKENHFSIGASGSFTIEDLKKRDYKKKEQSENE